ncbi:MAG: hypothetical protein HY226_00150 [Candidatus Vogelbacteria bacterium]|nr:hypothetical protein [Candidatus Vogelbacteria bacterium]
MSLYYHVVLLGEQVGDIFYIFRFYYGMFFLFFGFYAFLLWFDPGTKRALTWARSLASTVLIISFLLAVFEVAGLFLGVVHPSQLTWAHDRSIASITDGSFSLIRANSIAANPSVLGGFSLFLVLYLYGTSEHPTRFREAFVLVLGLATVLLSQSGTGLLLLAITFFVFCLRLSTFRKTETNALLLTVLVVMALGIIYSQFNEDGRLSPESREFYPFLLQLIADFVKDSSSPGYLSPFFGLINIRQFNKLDAEDLLWGNPTLQYYLRFYDFAYVAFLIELGIVGLASYLFSLRSLVNRAFPREDFAVRWGFGVLLLATLHYPVSFWVCSQVMVAVILATGIYVRETSSQDKR